MSLPPRYSCSVHTISPVRLTVSPSLTNRSEPKSTTPTWPASKFMHMPLTPDANLCCISAALLPVEAMVEQATYSTSSSACTLLIPCTRAIPSLRPIVSFVPSFESCGFGGGGGGGFSVPDGQNTAGLGETRLLLHTSDSLLENGGNLGGCSFGVDSICPELVGCGVENSWCSSGLSRRKTRQCSVAAQELPCQCDSRQQARRPKLRSSSERSFKLKSKA